MLGHPLKKYEDVRPLKEYEDVVDPGPYTGSELQGLFCKDVGREMLRLPTAAALHFVSSGPPGPRLRAPCIFNRNCQLDSSPHQVNKLNRTVKEKIKNGMRQESNNLTMQRSNNPDCWMVGLLDYWIVGLLDCGIVGIVGLSDRPAIG